MRAMLNIATLLGERRRHVVTLFFLAMYAIVLFSFWGGIVFFDNKALGGEGLRQSTMYFSLYIICIAIIHIWIYSTFKLKHSIEKLSEYFQKSNYMKVWSKYSHWFDPFPYDDVEIYEAIFKMLYTLTWVALFFLSLFCTDKLGLYKISSILDNNQSVVNRMVIIIGLALFIIGMFLNYFSFYASIILTYFIRNISNNSQYLEFNHTRPSATKEFHELIHISSRTAITFFFESMLYICLLVIPINIMPHDFYADNIIYWWLLMACTLIPCVISFLLVFLLPKLFLNRLLRRWKWMAIDEIDLKMQRIQKKTEKGLVEDEFSPLYVAYNDMLNVIYNDELPLVKTEMIVAAAALFVDIVSIGFSIISG